MLEDSILSMIITHIQCHIESLQRKGTVLLNFTSILMKVKIFSRECGNRLSYF